MREVVGLLVGTKKDGKSEYTVIHTLSDFDEYAESNYLVSGNVAESVYVPKRLDLMVGDKIDFVYGVGFGGKAVVKDVQVLEQVK